MAFETIEADDTGAIADVETGFHRQRRDDDCDAHIVYQVPVGNKPSKITHITLANVTNKKAKVNVFKSSDPKIMTQDTTIAWNLEVQKFGVVHLDGERYLPANGIIGYQQLTDNAITITVDGVEIS